jgi:hypothetical protein
VSLSVTIAIAIAITAVRDKDIRVAFLTKHKIRSPVEIDINNENMP